MDQPTATTAAELAAPADDVIVLPHSPDGGGARLTRGAELTLLGCVGLMVAWLTALAGAMVVRAALYGPSERCFWCARFALSFAIAGAAVAVGITLCSAMCYVCMSRAYNAYAPVGLARPETQDAEGAAPPAKED